MTSAATGRPAGNLQRAAEPTGRQNNRDEMKVIKKIVELQNELFKARKEGKEIGLVPTMGAETRNRG